MNQATQTEGYIGFKKVVLVLTTVVGGIVLVTALATAAFSTPWSRGTSQTSATTAGTEQIRVDTAAADFQMVFADVTEAQLDVTGSNPDRWTMVREGNTLAVKSSGRFCFWTCRGDATVTLTLPVELNDGSVALNVSVGAGRFGAKGQFSALKAHVGAGQLDIWAATPSADIDLGAGMATIGLQGADDVRLDIAAGRLVADLTGRAPTNLDVSVAVGSAVITVPDVPYQLNSDVAAGSIDATVDTTQSSSNVISVDVAAGHVAITPSRG